jgi:hypothetical protein
MKYPVEMPLGGIIYISSFMKTGKGVHTILRFCLNNILAVMLLLLMGGFYEVCCWDGLWCHDIYTKFHKDWFRHSKFLGGQGYEDSKVIS